MVLVPCATSLELSFPPSVLGWDKQLRGLQVESLHDAHDPSSFAARLHPSACVQVDMTPGRVGGRRHRAPPGRARTRLRLPPE